MAYQALQGVTITPKGSRNRFVAQKWGVSQAFGGWIFGGDYSIGYSNRPTEIKLKIVLEAGDITSKNPKSFDIGMDDLKCDAGAGGAGSESLFDIDFNGVKFTDFVLFNYDLDIQPMQKTLSVTFRDYSVILDKIYIGLVKRQGSEFINTAYAEGEIPVVCPDCTFNSVTGQGTMFRELDFGSYAGINGKTYNNFDTYIYGQVYDTWNTLYNASTKTPTFDLNGGYLILGTEEMYTEVCGTVPDVKYSFAQLYHSLRTRGINLSGAFLDPAVTGGTYTQNYIGTLREVLNNWCSDYGVQFYANGKGLIGLDLKKEVDITQILQIADPKSTIGSNFDAKNIALGSYKEAFSLENTYKQSVITADVRPREVKNESRNVKNFVKFTPLHPLDFYWPDLDYRIVSVTGQNGTNRYVNSQYFANNFEKVNKRMDNFTNRYFKDIDTSIALIKYDKNLRDIFCASRAVESWDPKGTPSAVAGDNNYGFTTDLYANFQALGFIPKRKIDDLSSKQIILKQFIDNLAQNVSIHPDFYDIYIGYYYPSIKDEVASFESNWANSMYKYGVLNVGTVDNPPFIIRDRNDLIEPTGGLYGSKGTSLLRITNSFSPNADVYPKKVNAPYFNLMPYHNFGFNTFNYYIGSLENEWGTTDDDFRKYLYEPLSPVCENMFAGSVTELADNPTLKTQHFNIGDFAPIFTSDIGKVYETIRTEFDNLGDDAIDNIGIFAVDTDNKLHQECAKLHIAIIPNIKNHPNVRISFTPYGYYDSYNTVMANSIVGQLEQNAINFYKQKPKNICDYSALTQICNDILSGRNVDNPQDIKYSCPNVDDPNTVLYAGWPISFINPAGINLTPVTALPKDQKAKFFAKNARTLNVSITRNPVTQLDSQGSDGASYYSEEGFSNITNLITSTSTVNIIYPFCNKPADYDLAYVGVMDTQIERENRAPSSFEIYGEPTNSANNNTSSIRVINNTIDSDIQPILDPNSRRFIKYTTVITGNSTKSLTTIKEYHDFISDLNGYQALYPSKMADFNIIGSPNLFGNFSGYMTPLSGLVNFNVTIGDNGVETSLSFSNKPPVLPKQEAILNKIGPRLKPK